MIRTVNHNVMMQAVFIENKLWNHISWVLVQTLFLSRALNDALIYKFVSIYMHSVASKALWLFDQLNVLLWTIGCINFNSIKNKLERSLSSTNFKLNAILKNSSEIKWNSISITYG